MSNPRVLITAGCSFSQVPNSDVTWPVHLQKSLQADVVLYLGQGAAGNGIISRRVIHHVSNLLKTYNNNDMLVGIMWSGRNRFEVYSKEHIPHYKLSSAIRYRNPVEVIGDRNYYLLNNHWNDDSTTTFFRHFYNEHYGAIITLEHILRTQWFLKLHKVNYFMCQYHHDVLPNPSLNGADKELMDNPDILHLYEQIDFENWIWHNYQFNNLHKFAVDSGLPFARPPDPHPATEHHELFVTNKVMPMLIDRKIYVHPD